MRIEPAPSEPWATGPSPAATAAAAPPEDPPDVRSSFQGFRHGGPIRLSHMSLWPKCGVLVFPSSTPPDPFMRAATTPSSSGTLRSKNLEPYVVRMPAVGSRSLMEYGMPSSGPAGSPLSARASAALASARARAAVTVRKALRVGLSRSTRLRTASATSTGETSRAPINRLSSVAGVKHRSGVSMLTSLTESCVCLPFLYKSGFCSARGEERRPGRRPTAGARDPGTTLRPPLT